MKLLKKAVGGKNYVTVHVDTSEIDKAIRKAERLNNLLGEASSLLCELASREINLSVNIKD